ncbi:hypothetical protein CRENBAI_015583 [Crenichthys baileyi]|uniref:Uncharacterized protein n=1 Tax=Crenichthys baileyi TaxID=28760 RepID=A0AAV9R0W1_9TELE
MLHHTTHPSASCRLAPGQAPEPQKETMEEGHHKDRQGHPHYRTCAFKKKTRWGRESATPTPPPTDPPPRQQNALLEGKSTCNEMVPTHQFRKPLSLSMHKHGPSMYRPKTPATYPPGPSPQGPARTPARGRHAPGTQSLQAHPRPAQEQHDHKASNLCLPAQFPQKHRRQPPDVTPESHQSPTPAVGVTAPGARPPSDPSPGTPQMPQTQTTPCICHNTPQNEAKGDQYKSQDLHNPTEGFYTG